MQEDMHFYGTYAMARAAGVRQKDAFTIAYSAQFVDDSTKQDSEQHDDGSLIYGIATAHHAVDSGLNVWKDKLSAEISGAEKELKEEQRRVWVPFHFIPGGEGETFHEKLICQKDSKIANEFFNLYVQKAIAKEKKFSLHLLGIGAHVYADTFSHYEFSGLSSEYNKVVNDSFKFHTKNKNILGYITSKANKLIEKQKNSIISNFLEFGSDGLGHGAVATYPDRPYLHWEVEFELARTGKGKDCERNNPETFLEACGKLHQYFSKFAKARYTNQYKGKKFSEIEEVVSEILNFEGAKKERIKKWTDAIKSGKLFKPNKDDKEVHYNPSDWETEKKEFHELKDSSEATKKDVYLFHQAATYHRYYVLKDLLPSHGIVVY